MAWNYPWAPEAKVFWFFSSEKNILSIEFLARAAVAACEDGVVIPANRLRAEGAQPALLKALAAVQ